jgi:hypothetical protein
MLECPGHPLDPHPFASSATGDTRRPQEPDRDRHFERSRSGVLQFRQVELRNAGLVQRKATFILAFLSSGPRN